MKKQEEIMNKGYRTAKVQVIAKAFTVPEYILLEGVSDQPNVLNKLPLSYFSSDDLAFLCEEFEAEIFKRAGKHRHSRLDVHEQTRAPKV